MDSRRYGETAKTIGRFILQDLKNVSARVDAEIPKADRRPFSVISPEFAGRLMGNTSTLYAFLQKRPESAEIISGMAGTRTVWKETVQSDKFFGIDIPTGGKSLREVEEFVIHPNLVKTLRVGKCVCVKKYPSSRAYLVNVFAS